MLRWRLILGTVIIAALVGLCRLDACAGTPGIWLMPIVLLLAGMATQETLGLLAAVGSRPLPEVVHPIVLWSIVSVWLAASGHTVETQMYSWVLASVLYVFPLFAVFISEMCRYRNPGQSLMNIAGAIFVWIYVGWLLMFAVQLRLDWGIHAMAAWIVVVKMGDTGAYTVGRLIGRHKMAPLISPGKTLEGAVGALAFSCLGSWVMVQWLFPATMPGPTWGWIAFGLLVGAAGMIGDLAESLLKRDAGVKDSSTWMPGFGGVLDILDSLLLSAPVAYFCWQSGMLGM